MQLEACSLTACVLSFVVRLAMSTTSSSMSTCFWPLSEFAKYYHTATIETHQVRLPSGSVLPIMDVNIRGHVRICGVIYDPDVISGLVAHLFSAALLARS